MKSLPVLFAPQPNLGEPTAPNSSVTEPQLPAADVFLARAQGYRGKLTWVGSEALGRTCIGRYQKPVPRGYRVPHGIIAENESYAFFIHGFASWIDDNKERASPLPVTNDTSMACFDYVYLCMHEAGVVNFSGLQAVYDDIATLRSFSNDQDIPYHRLAIKDARNFDGQEKPGDLVFMWCSGVPTHIAILSANEGTPHVLSLSSYPDGTVYEEPLAAFPPWEMRYVPFELARDSLMQTSTHGHCGGAQQQRLAANQSEILGMVAGK